MVDIIGIQAIDRKDIFSSGVIINKGGQSNIEGKISKIEMYFDKVIENKINIATFYEVPGENKLSMRSYVSLAAPSKGLNTWIAPASFTPVEVRIGDYIGFNGPAGFTIDSDNFGSGVWWYDDEFSWKPDIQISLCATGIKLEELYSTRKVPGKGMAEIKCRRCGSEYVGHSPDETKWWCNNCGETRKI